MKTKLAILLIVILLGVSPWAKAAIGEVVSWRANAYSEANRTPLDAQMTGQVAKGTVVVAGQIVTNAIAVAAGMANSLVLTADGSVFNWGGTSNGAEQVKIGDAVLSDVVAVSEGRMHSVALRKNGAVLAWGNNDQGQGVVPKWLRNVTAISAGGNHTLAVTGDGTVMSWGEGNPPPFGLSNIVAVSASKLWDTGHDLALTSSGEVIQWNVKGVPGQGALPPELTNAVAISAGGNHNLALLKGGRVFGWGDNSLGQAIGTATTNAPFYASGPVSLGGNVLSNVVAVAAGNQFSLALKSDGTVVGWGRIGGNRTPVAVPDGLSNVVAIAVGDYYCLAIITNTAVAEKFSH